MPTELFVVRAAARADETRRGRRPLLARVAAGGLIAPPAPLVAMLSGGRDSVCMLDLAVRAPRRRRRSPRSTSTTACATTPTRTSASAPSSARRLGVELAIERPRPPRGPRQPAGLGARRPLRRRGARWRCRAGATIVTGHTADDQVETILYRLASSPSRRALLGMRPRDGSLARPLLGTTRAEIDRLLRGARPRLARGRYQRRSRPTPATGSATACCRSWRTVHPAAVANVLRTAELLRDEAEVLDAAGRRRARRLRRGARGTIALERAAPSCTRRCAGSSSSGSPTPPPAGRSPAPPATPSRSPALRRTGIAMLDLGGGVRAVVERGVLRAERDPEPRPRSAVLHLDCGPWTTRRSARPSSPARNCSGGSPSWAPRSAATTRAATWSWSGC